MKTMFKKGLKYSVATVLFCFALLLVFIFNPVFLYAKKTEYKNFTIYHTALLNKNLEETFDAGLKSLQKSDLYHDTIKIDICLDDGSVYPKLIEAIMGTDIIRSFANKSIFHCIIDSKSVDSMTKQDWGESFSVSQWTTHSFVHCLQFEKYGLFGSNPIARIPEWQWEGYAEYMSIRTSQNLGRLITLYLTSKKNKYEWVKLGSYKTTLSHIRYFLLMKYCIDIKKIDFEQVISLKESEEVIFNELLTWYKSQKNA